MRIAHIIVAHKNPLQLEKLIAALQHEDADYYIHLDKKVNIQPFLYLKHIQNVRFITKRVRCNWGGYSLVRAILQSIEEIISTQIAYDFVNLISGQDYPVKPVKEIHTFLNAHLGKSFVSVEKEDALDWWKGAEQRYKQFHLTDMQFKGKYFIQGWLNKLSKERTFPLELKRYGSSDSSWWTISLAAAKYVLQYLKNNPKLTAFLQYTWTPDEFVMATVLMNSPLKAQVINNNYRYIDWSAGEAHPKTLDIKDFDKIIHSGMLFARKFDSNADDRIMVKIDQYTANNTL